MTALSRNARKQLIKALNATGKGYMRPGEIVDDLLLVVAELADLRAAEELRAAASAGETFIGPAAHRATLNLLCARADALANPPSSAPAPPKGQRRE